MTTEYPARYALIENFLSSEVRSRLIDYVLSEEANFVPTTTSTGALDYRQSKILYAFPEFSDQMVQQIRPVLPTVFAQLEFPEFPIADIEIQLTAHNDDHYYKIHNDNGSDEAASRQLTYVYYFYREPKAFSGGALRLYDLKVDQGYYVAAERFTTLEPVNNTIVFFPSHLMHEVMPVACPSRSFGDSRFTLNGWIRR
jgi:Rps23 Pro-64 3,4-dihydroxylase Tpa1-like proline 4-hydroxylase